jgi:hypothetical protein
MTASQLIAHLQEHYSDRPDEILVYTFWDSTDIEIMLDDNDLEATDVWKVIAEDAEDSLEEAISDVSDRINDLVQSYQEEK